MQRRTLRGPLAAWWTDAGTWRAHLQRCSSWGRRDSDCLVKTLLVRPKTWLSCSVTKKGWSISARIVFSEITWSTCLSLIMSAFFRRFIAKYSPDFLFLASMTRPKEPGKVKIVAFTCTKSGGHIIVSQVDFALGCQRHFWNINSNEIQHHQSAKGSSSYGTSGDSKSESGYD